jgi:hypothetical protein
MLKELNDDRIKIVDLEQKHKNDVDKLNETYHKKIELNTEEAVKRELELKHAINTQLSQIETCKSINEERTKNKNDLKSEITNNIRKESDLQEQIQSLEDELIFLRVTKINKEKEHTEHLKELKDEKSSIIKAYINQKEELEATICKLSGELSNQQETSINTELKLNDQLVYNKTSLNNNIHDYTKLENSLNLKPKHKIIL